MNGRPDPFGNSGELVLEDEIAHAARACELTLSPAAIAALASHARNVLLANPELKLTSITDPREFLERHLGEAFQGAMLIAPDASGVLLDLGSGNGYPGLPIAQALPRMRPVLAEASRRKAAFLRSLLERDFAGGAVLEAQIQRASDLADVGPIRLLVTRAMGNWERTLPRLRDTLADDGELLVWAGERMEEVLTRKAWKRYELLTRKALAARERSWIWNFRKA